MKCVGLWLSTFLCVVSCKTSNFSQSPASTQIPVGETELFQQVNYPSREVSLQQGRQGLYIMEQFEQKALALDIVLVIDNSGSMAEEQKELAGRIQPLLESVKESDWRISVLTTDVADPCSRALLRKGDQNIAEKFAAAIQAGTQGSGVERGILRAVQGIECNNWLREDSVLAVLIVSDEDNCSISNGVYDCQNAPDELSGKILLDKLANIRIPGETGRVYGIIHGPGDDRSQCADNNNVEGRIYDDVIKQTKGVRGPICAKDYTKTLSAISNDLRTLLKNEFVIGMRPDEGTLQVYIEGKKTEEFQLQEKTVILKDVLEQGKSVLVEYQTGSEGEVFETVQIEAEVLDGSVLVTENGEPVKEGVYKLEMSDNGSSKIVFYQRPDDGSELTIQYKEPVPLAKSFTLAYRPIATSMKVKINGEETQSFRLSDSQQSIEFAEPPLAGAEIQVTYLRSSQSSGEEAGEL